MNADFLAVLEYWEKEKGISRIRQKLQVAQVVFLEKDQEQVFKSSVICPKHKTII